MRAATTLTGHGFTGVREVEVKVEVVRGRDRKR
jgi:hypothetical protein